MKMGKHACGRNCNHNERLDAIQQTLDAVSVTAYLRDLVRIFTEGVGRHYASQKKKELQAIDDCFQLLLGRSPTDEEIQRIIPW